MDYIDFLQSKQERTVFEGLTVSAEELNKNMFDWQRAVDGWALKKGRAALFEDCGLGKTLQQLEWARQVHKNTGGNILILVELVDCKGIYGLHEDDTKMNATSYHRQLKKSAPSRVARTAELTTEIDGQVVIWCNTNDEADMLKQAIPDAVEVRGSHKSEYKEQAAIDFINGKFRVLISKSTMFGYGLNFQNCCNTIFCGRDFSYENYYQATRRFWRYGQDKPVNVYTVIGESEQQILDVVGEKIDLQEEMKRNMYTGLKQIQVASIQGHTFKLNTDVRKISLPAWLEKGA